MKNNGLQEEVKVAEERGFYDAVLVCLQILCMHDSHTQAMEIVRAVGGIKKIEAHARRSGSDVDVDTVRWLKTCQAPGRAHPLERFYPNDNSC